MREGEKVRGGGEGGEGGKGERGGKNGEIPGGGEQV